MGRGRWLPGPAGARTPITGSHQEPGRRALAQPGSPAWLFFSIHAAAPSSRSRRRRRRRRPSGLAGGRGAGTFPRPVARAAHRRRCRRGPGTWPGQSERAGWGWAGRWLSPGWCPGPAPHFCPPPAHRRPRPPAELLGSRRTAAGQGRAPGAGRSPPPPPLAPPHTAANPRSEAPIGRSTRLPRSRGPAPAPTSPPSAPSPYPWEGAQRGKGMVEFLPETELEWDQCARTSRSRAPSGRCS